jgi:glycosyltransferase 2 family protein
VLAAAGAWRCVLADLGSRLPVTGAFRVFLVGALGKYLPGSVWFLFAQTQMAARQHVPRQRAASASIVTVVLTIATAALASLVVVPFAGGLPGWFRWTPLLLPVILAALYPPLLNRVMGRVFELIRRPPLEHELSALGIARAVAWSLLSWVAVGGQVAVLAVTVGAPLELRTVVLCLGGYALAWGLGFAAVVAPAGAGAREATLALALSPVLSPGPALVVVLVSRVLLTVADLSLAGLFGSGLGRLGESAGEPEPSR